MATKTYVCPDISCHHCTMTIERELKMVDGVTSVQADLDTKRVVVEVTDESLFPQVEATLVEIGYPPAPEVTLA